MSFHGNDKMPLDNHEAQEILSNHNIGEVMGQIELIDDINDLRLLLYSAKRNNNLKEIIYMIEEKMRVMQNA